MSYKCKTNHHNVNSKHLIRDIEDLVEEALNTAGFSWSSGVHRQAIVDLVIDLLYNKQEAGLIYNYKVACQTSGQPHAAAAVLTIKFRQANCLNQTTLEYLFKEIPADIPEPSV